MSHIRYKIEIKALINNKFMLIKKCSKSLNLCINLVFRVFLLKLIYIFLIFNLIINESKLIFIL